MNTNVIMHVTFDRKTLSALTQHHSPLSAQCQSPGRLFSSLQIQQPHEFSVPAGSCSSPNISGNFWLMCARQLPIQFTDSPDNIKALLEKRQQSYITCINISRSYFLYWLHLFRQQATHSSHTFTTRTAWNKHKFTTRPNGSSCYQNSFISTSQNSAIHTYHNWRGLFDSITYSEDFHTCFQLSYSVELCFRFYTPHSAAFVLC